MSSVTWGSISKEGALELNAEPAAAGANVLKLLVELSLGAPVANKNVLLFIGVAIHQVSCWGIKNDEAAIAADRRVVLVSLNLGTVRCNADPLGDPGRAVVDEDVTNTICIACHQILGN